VRESSLTRILWSQVVGAVRTASGGLALTFNGGAVVEIEDDSIQYESYSIRTPDGEIYI
jgi:hypothetical protein